MKEVLVKARKHTLCMMAQHLCGLTRQGEALLTLKDVQRNCAFVAGLCREVGCKKQPNSCMAATKAKTEKEFQEHCLVSRKACDESRVGKKPNGTNPISV